MKMRLLALVALSLAIFLPLAVFLVKGMVHGMLYPTPNIPVGRPPDGFIEVALPLKSGELCQAWFFPGSGPVLVYFHGNGENLETLRMGGLLDMMKSFGVPLLLVEYPGYGRCTGRASEESIGRLADAAVEWVGARKPDSGWIAAGWSLGAAVAVQAASRNTHDLKGVVILSGWSSLKEMAEAHFPAWMIRLLLKEQYDSVSAAAKLSCPVLVIHGEEDTLIPAALGKKLAASFSRARWVAMPATGHNDLLSNPRVREELADYIDSVKQ